MTYFYIFMHF